jgi:hypothetical protein
LLGDRGFGAVGADDGAGAHGHVGIAVGGVGRTVVYDGDVPSLIAGDPRVGAVAPLGAGRRGTFAQPLIEWAAVDHADETAIDGHVHVAVAGCDHARGMDVRHQL